MTTNGLPTNSSAPPNGSHLSDDQLNRYLDGDLSVDDRREADLHLATCEACAGTLGELGAISTLLGSLPEVRLPRSFQLGASHVRNRTSLWDRIGTMLLPALPALRAGTLAIALAFVSVTAYRVVDDSSSTGPATGDFAVQTMPTSSILINLTATNAVQGRVAETDTVATESDLAFEASEAESEDEAPEPESGESDGGDAGSSELAPPAEEADQSGGAAPEAAEDAGDEDASNETMTMFEAPGDSEADDAAADSAESQSESLEMAQSAPVEASPTTEPTLTETATALPSATRTATAVPTPLPTELPAPAAEESDDSSWLGWAQLVLGTMLALLGGLVVGVHRLRKKVNG